MCPANDKETDEHAGPFLVRDASMTASGVAAPTHRGLPTTSGRKSPATTTRTTTTYGSDTR